MYTKKIKAKGFGVKEVDNDTLVLINKNTKEEVTKDDVYVFDLILCDNEIDRDYEKMTPEFLKEVASKGAGLVGIKNHEWDAKNQWARILSCRYVETDELTLQGDKRSYVLATAYTSKCYKDIVESINLGIIKEVSLSFESVDDTCSICGKTECEHEKGKVYDDKLCYKNLEHLKELFEWSLVAVPCQRGAGIKNKGLGGIKMKKRLFGFELLKNSKAFKSASEEELKLIENVASAEDEDITEEEVKALIAENSALKEEVEKLKGELEEIKVKGEQDNVEKVLCEVVDSLKPINDGVSDYIKADLKGCNYKAEDVEDVEKLKGELVEKYKGLLDNSDDEDTKKEATVVNEEEEEEVKQKSAKSKPRIVFGTDSSKANNKSAKKVGLFIK